MHSMDCRVRYRAGNMSWLHCRMNWANTFMGYPNEIQNIPYCRFGHLQIIDSYRKMLLTHGLMQNISDSLTLKNIAAF